MNRLIIAAALAGFSGAQQPAGEKLLMKWHGKGDQIYRCQNMDGMYAWKLKAPEAKLYSESGELVGRHFAGPSWEANDMSVVQGKVVSSTAVPGSIPALLLIATTHDGDGTMQHVAGIRRMNTAGGVAPVTACDASKAKAEVRVPYEADYYFYASADR